MKIPGAFMLFFLVTRVVLGQNYIPKDLKTSRVLAIEYSYADWDNQFSDSTHGQWFLRRFGKDPLYGSYKSALDAAVKTLKKHRIEVNVVDSRGLFDKRNYNYIFDFKETVFDNDESIIADKRIGGFFFENPKVNEKYDAMIENKQWIKKQIRRGL